MANLLQVSSPFGRPMESIDRSALILSIYSDLIEAQVVDNRGRREVQSLIAASADGYAFPTNLDNDQPADGRASSAQADLLAQALAGRRTHDEPALRLAARVVPSVNPGVAGASCGT